MKIFLAGDSFSYNNKGWPSMLGHDIVNQSENGVGEFKIFEKCSNLWSYDRIIICHTSPWSVHTPSHPVHAKDIDRPNNDFILADVDYHSTRNNEMFLVKKYLGKFYDDNYQKTIYDLMVNQTMQIKKSLHITFHKHEDTKLIPNNFNEIYEKNKGDINHMNDKGNLLVANEIKKLL